MASPHVVETVQAPLDVIEYDLSGAVYPIALTSGCRSIEIADGPSTAPYSTLVVKLRGLTDTAGSVTRTLTYLDPGWEHDMQATSIESGTTATRIRVWI